MQTDERLLTVEQFAARLHISRAMAFRILKKNPAAPRRVRLGTHTVRLRESDVDRFVELAMEPA
jgi:predicted DNA-binding transcriptional regulator AlpA